MGRWSIHAADAKSFLDGNEWQLVKEGHTAGQWLLNQERLDDAGFLPVEDKAVKNLALLLAPNRLSMATFYMFLAEARRVVPENGLLAILTKDEPVGAVEKLRAFWREVFLGHPRGLNPEHYVSPEHWILIRKARKEIRGIPVAFAEFRRTDFT